MDEEERQAHGGSYVSLFFGRASVVCTLLALLVACGGHFILGCAVFLVGELLCYVGWRFALRGHFQQALRSRRVIDKGRPGAPAPQFPPVQEHVQVFDPATFAGRFGRHSADAQWAAVLSTFVILFVSLFATPLLSGFGKTLLAGDRATSGPEWGLIATWFILGWVCVPGGVFVTIAWLVPAVRALRR